MIILNNLLINKNSQKYQPFLLNLISGRRRLLSQDELMMVHNLKANKGLSEYEIKLYNNLIAEKQFMTEKYRNYLEQKLDENNYFIKNEIADDYSFSIELTRDCNMRCPFCYVKDRLNSNTSMTKAYIDSIYDFYLKYCDDINKIINTKNIRITGGEPLINDESVNLINYISEKWYNAKISLFTNGINLLKYYDKLPISKLGEVDISLDGIKKIHIDRRYNKSTGNYNIYDNIIYGIKKLINDEVNVIIKTVVDKDSYKYILEFKKFLKEEGILDSEHCEWTISFTLDFQNELDIDEKYNNIEEIEEINKYLVKNKIGSIGFLSSSNLFRVLSRPKDQVYYPRIYRCSIKKLSKCYFGCNGNIYYCDCIDENRGIIGTFYPYAELKKFEISELLNRNIMTNEKCKKCSYKFICLGGCPLSSIAKDKNESCGIFKEEKILDNLEFDYNSIK